jgi:hypothetical protein
MGFKIAGAFKSSILIEKGLVDFHFPFLPLEKEHVRQCIHAEFKSRKQTTSQEEVE